MFMKQDWFLRQTEVVAVAIAQLVFGKGEVEHDLREEARSTPGDPLSAGLWELLARHELGAAEDRLFALLDPVEPCRLALAAEFYRHANGFSDEELMG